MQPHSYGTYPTVPINYWQNYPVNGNPAQNRSLQQPVITPRNQYSSQITRYSQASVQNGMYLVNQPVSSAISPPVAAMMPIVRPSQPLQVNHYPYIANGVSPVDPNGYVFDRNLHKIGIPGYRNYGHNSERTRPKHLKEYRLTRTKHGVRHHHSQNNENASAKSNERLKRMPPSEKQRPISAASSCSHCSTCTNCSCSACLNESPRHFYDDCTQCRIEQRRLMAERKKLK